MGDLPGKAPKSRSLPHRFRVSVPVADEAVVAWMELQDNPSLSVRMLIRENIERHGFVDVVNRPVAQLPKRGRPASAGGAEAQELSGQTGREPLEIRYNALDEARNTSEQPVHAPAGAETGELLNFQEEAEAPELLGIALESPTLNREPRPAPVPASVPVPALPEPEPAPGGQLEVADIFSALR